MSREYAVSLLEKANGDVAVAVDIFYSSSESNNVIDADKNIMLQNAQGETVDKCSETDMARIYFSLSNKMLVHNDYIKMN
jgi:DNA ligase 1